jgi:hypothetical protein
VRGEIDFPSAVAAVLNLSALQGKRCRNGASCPPACPKRTGRGCASRLDTPRKIVCTPKSAPEIVRRKTHQRPFTQFLSPCARLPR